MLLLKISVFIELDECPIPKYQLEVLACALNSSTFQERWIHPEIGVI